MHYIYCYTNKINGHKYVGQTNNFNRRVREHQWSAFQPTSSSYNNLFHKKIRQYGIENFTVEILETLYPNDLEEVNQREIYWIEKLQSHVSTGQGYNISKGGNNKEHLHKYDDKTIKIIKEKIKNGISFLDLIEEYHASASFLSSINHGIYYRDGNENYPLYKYYKDDDDYEELIDLLLNSPLTLREISKQLQIGYSTVKKINAGTLKKGLYPTYPIRKKSAYELRADKIKELLLTTNLSNKDIAEIVKANEDTVRRIKIGETWRDEKLSYPL